MRSESEVTQLCPTLSDPMDRSLPGSSVHGIFQARLLQWGAMAFSMAPSKTSELQLIMVLSFVFMSCHLHHCEADGIFPLTHSAKSSDH